jgi:hypothetical protein
VNAKFDVITALLPKEAMKGTATGEDLYGSMSASFERHKLSWNKLISVTTHGSPNLTDKGLGLLKRVQDSFHKSVLIGKY